MNKDLIINKIVKDLPIKEMRSKMSDVEWAGWFEECWNEAINFTHCCKSDSEQLVLFADWLQYNGKWSLPEQQAKDFLKEQQEQN